jgi:hypothetical protein
MGRTEQRLSQDVDTGGPEGSEAKEYDWTLLRLLVTIMVLAYIIWQAL